MSGDYNILLSEKREFHDAEKEYIEKAEEEGLCEVDTEPYIKCANPSDPDYKWIPDRNCDGVVDLSLLICPECNREVTEADSKQRFEKDVVRIHKPGVRDWLRKRLKNSLDARVRTVSRKYCGQRIEYVLNISEPSANVFVLDQNLGREFMKWCKIYDENPVAFLIDEAIPMRTYTEELELPTFTIQDAFPDLNKDALEAINNAESGPLKHRSIKGRAAHDLGSDESVLETMSYDDFERCVQSLLLGTIGNSQLLGSSETGSGVPDGTLNLHFEDNDMLYMWDAKYVDYVIGEDNETTLSDEYDRIFRHLKDQEKRKQIKTEFGRVQGILLFSPGIKETNIVRLAKFIQEQNLLEETTWGGTVVCFTFDALLSLFNAYNNDTYSVKRKEENFRLVLHSFLSNPSNHEEEPPAIRESKQKCLHMSEKDIDSIFEKIEEFGPEESIFDVEEHMAHLDLVRA